LQTAIEQLMWLCGTRKVKKLIRVRGNHWSAAI